MSATKQGDAVFRWTESSQPYLHHLGAQLRNLAPSRPETVYRWDSPDFATTRVVSIASSGRDLSATIVYDGNPLELEELLAAGRRGASIDYIPSKAVPSDTYPCILVAAGPVQLAPDPDFWWEYRYTAAVVLRRTDGGTWRGVTTGSLFHYQAGAQPPGFTFARSGTANYVDEDGILQSAADGIQRVTWLDLDGDGVREPYLLNEVTRSNLLLQSEDFSTTWGVTRASVATDSTTAPDAATTADTLTEDGTASSTHYTHQSVTKAASSIIYTLSVYVKAKERSGMRLRLDDGTDTNGVYVDFATISGAAGSVTTFGSGWSAHQAGSWALANGWYRLWMTVTSDTATTIRTLLMLHDGTSHSYNGDGSSGIYLWGAQLETVSTITGYIKTTVAAATRNSETFYGDFPFSPEVIAQRGGMTAYVKMYEHGTAFLANGGVLHIGSATVDADERFQIRGDGSGSYECLHDNGIDNRLTAATAAVTRGDKVELRAHMAADGSVLLGQSVNSAAEAVTATTSAATPTSAFAGSRIYIGSLGSSTPGANPIAEVKILPGSKTMAEMRAA